MNQRTKANAYAAPLKSTLLLLGLGMALASCGSGGGGGTNGGGTNPGGGSGAIQGSVQANLAATSVDTTQALSTPPADPSGLQGPRATAGERVIPGEFLVKFRDMQAAKVTQLNVKGRELQVERSVGTAGTKLLSAAGLSRAESDKVLAALRARPDVEYAEPNVVYQAFRTPNDTHYATRQWNLPAMNLPVAWNITVGSSSIIVAVLDTGLLTDHPDINGKLVAGYDFVSDPTMANDGGGRDPNPYDPGMDDCDSGGCTSSYHGTHVAGTVGALSNNSRGIAGVDWNARVLPVRVLGRGGGSLADITEALLWSAGATVSGVPANANPAHVINLSLGGSGSCPSSLQHAINTATARGAIVVVAAGNDNVDAAGASPANCANVITVGAVGPTGTRASYSNYGTTIDVMAPGGDTGGGIYSLFKSDATNTFGYTYMAGTSMAAPHVAGVVSLLKSLNASMTFAEVLGNLKRYAKPLTATQCNRPSGAECGTGLINAATSVLGDTVVQATSTQTGQVVTRSNLGSVTGSASFQLSSLPAGSYSVFAFRDLNGNQIPDTGERRTASQSVQVTTGGTASGVVLSF